jgi:hypothetical protein
LGNPARKNAEGAVINSYHEDVVRELLTPPWPHDDHLTFAPRVHPDAEKIRREVEKWSGDPKARRRIERELANEGYDEAYILTTVLNRAADAVDAIDRRIASYELRRLTALRAIEQYSETLARRLEAGSSKVIEGQLNEAAE